MIFLVDIIPKMLLIALVTNLIEFKLKLYASDISKYNLFAPN